MSTMVERLALVLSEKGYEIDGDMFHYTPEERPHSYNALVRAILEAMIPFLREVPNTSLVETGQRDPHWIWDDAADSQREAILGCVQSALKENENA